MGWRPRSRRAEVDSDYDALHDGVPPWLRGSLLSWVRPFFEQESDWGTQVDESRLFEVERRLHISLAGRDRFVRLEDLFSQLEADEELLLDMVDLAAAWAVRRISSVEEAGRRLAYLDHALTEAGSVWRVALSDDNPPRASLERRVDETVTKAARDVMSASGRAGEYLAQAWNEAYGRDPSPSEAYRHAVRAVEVAAIPIVIPDDPKATLGRAIGAMRDAPRKWSVTLSPPDGSDPVETVLQMCDLLWKSQWDRHGVLDESVPLNVSQEEAEAAGHLATTLVQWFSGGAVKRR